METKTFTKQDDLFFLQVRLFRLLQIKFNIDFKKCSEIFHKYKVYDYIETCYEFFHTQGDEENLNDVLIYLKNNGFDYDFTR